MRISIMNREETEPLGKFGSNWRMEGAACKNCRLPERARRYTAKVMDRKVKAPKPPTNRVEKPRNEFRVRPYPYNLIR